MEQIWLQGKERAKKKPANRQEEMSEKERSNSSGSVWIGWKTGVKAGERRNGSLVDWSLTQTMSCSWNTGERARASVEQCDREKGIRQKHVHTASLTQKTESVVRQRSSQNKRHLWVRFCTSGLNHYKPPETEQERAEEISAPRQPPQRLCSFQNQLRIHGTR